MDAIIKNGYNRDAAIECSDPLKIDVSVADYVAEIRPSKYEEKDKQQPFILCEFEEVTLKIEAWNGYIGFWTFSPGPWPIPLKRIFKDVDNTKDDLQISYY